MFFRFHDLYECETGSDITLFLGGQEEIERVPAHVNVLVQNDWFRSCLQGPLARPQVKELRFPEDPVRGLNQFLR